MESDETILKGYKMKTTVTTLTENENTVQLKESANNIQATILSIDKNTVIKKVASANIKVEKENILTYVKKLLETPTAKIEEENPLFAGTNILYLYLQAHLAHVEIEDKSTNKVIDLILWTVKNTGINPLNLINDYKELEVLKKYFNNLYIDENTTRETVQNQLNYVIKFEGFISNYMLGDKSDAPTPIALRKASELKPLFTDLKANGKKLKDFLYSEIVEQLAIIDTLKKAMQ